MYSRYHIKNKPTHKSRELDELHNSVLYLNPYQ